MSEFGYHVAGASQSGSAAILTTLFTSPNEAGTITQISVFCVRNGLDGHIRVAIYADSGGTPGAKLAESASETVVGVTETWYDVAISYGFTANTPYWLAVENDTAVNTDYDANGSATQTSYKTNTYPTWPSPFGAPDGQLPWQLSIYATYTPAASSPSASVSPSASLSPSASVSLSQSPSSSASKSLSPSASASPSSSVSPSVSPSASQSPSSSRSPSVSPSASQSPSSSASKSLSPSSSVSASPSPGTLVVMGRTVLDYD